MEWEGFKADHESEASVVLVLSCSLWNRCQIISKAAGFEGFKGHRSEKVLNLGSSKDPKVLMIFKRMGL